MKTVRCVIIFCIIMLMTACSKKIDENTVPDSIVGKWIEDRLYEYVFDKDGNVTVSAEWFELNGTYTVEGNELQITMEYNGSYKQPCSFRFLMTAEAGRYKLEREYDKDTDGKYIPYEPAGLASGFLSAFSDEVFF